MRLLRRKCYIVVIIQMFVLGGGSFSGMLQSIGGKMTEEAFELVLKKFELDVRILFMNFISKILTIM